MTKTMKKSMLAGLVAATLLTAGFALNTQSVDADSTCVLTIRTGASVRIGGESGTGIRFTADIPTAYVKEVVDGETTTYEVDYSKGITEMGMIVVPSFTLEGLEEGENVFDHLQADWNAPKNEVSSMLTKVYKDENADTYYVAGAIIDLQDVNIDETYQAIPYTYDGTDYTFGEASQERTIHQVFNAALEQETDAVKRDKLLNKVVEMQSKLDFGDIRISNFDGADLSKFAGPENWTIENAGIGSDVADVADGQLAVGALPGAITRRKENQDFTLTYANGKTLTFPAQVWMKEVSEFSDLQEMAALTATETQYKLGYVGVTKDITCNKNTELKMNGISGGSNPDKSAVVDYIFDGQGHTITNFYGALGNQIRAKFMNLNMIDCYSPAGRGLFGAVMIGGSSVENVNITTTLFKWDVSSGIANDVRNGTLTMTNVNIVAIDTLVDTSYEAGTRHGVIMGRAMKDNSGKLDLTDCTFIGVDVNKTDILPLVGAPSTAGDTNYYGINHIGSDAYNSSIGGTYKHYGYKNLGQLTFSTANETASFQAFVTANNLKSNWGPINVSPIAVSDTQGLKDMVGYSTAKSNGYYYLNNDIIFDPTTFGFSAVEESSTTGRAYSSLAFVEGNGFAIKGLNRHLFNKFGGTVQNLAIIASETQTPGWGRGLIAAYSFGTMTVENVFINWNLNTGNANLGLTNLDGGIVANASSPMKLKDVVIVCNNVGEQYYSGAIAGVVRKVAGEGSANGQAVTCDNDNTVVITTTRLAGAVADTHNANSIWFGAADFGNNYANFMTGTWNQYADKDTFERDYKGTLTAHNLKYYQQVVNAEYKKA